MCINILPFTDTELVVFFFHCVVCDDHHFKDEFLFYRFNNDEKPSYRSPTLKRDSQKHSRKNRGRGDGGEGGGGNGGSDDSGNYNESSENQHSDGSVGSRDTPTPLQESVETDE